MMKHVLLSVTILSGLMLANPVLADTAVVVDRVVTAVGKDAVKNNGSTIGSVAAVANTAATATSVIGASGASIMSTMVTGPSAGVVGGFAAARLMNDHLYSNCEQQTQNACDNAKYGTYAGAITGTATSVGALAVAGAGPAGLAAIGATVGGGMAAGAVAVVAAPVVAAAAVGGLVYWLFK
jgi:hypothetical protein